MTDRADAGRGATMQWRRATRATPVANRIAKRHYTCQSPESGQFVPPGRDVTLLTLAGDAVWVTSWPYPQFVKHAWAGAWVCSIFRNEGPALSSDLIRQAVAATRWEWPDVPALGIVTFVDAGKVRHKRDPGRCFVKAGWRRLKQRTRGGLVVLQQLPAEMPDPAPAIGVTFRMEATA